MPTDTKTCPNGHVTTIGPLARKFGFTACDARADGCEYVWDTAELKVKQGRLANA